MMLSPVVDPVEVTYAPRSSYTTERPERTYLEEVAGQKPSEQVQQSSCCMSSLALK